MAATPDAGGVRCVIGLGSNLDDPVAQLRAALAELAALTGLGALRVSPLYASAPLGPPDQPDYVNAVATAQVTLTPHALLDQLQAIEARHGRVRGVRWGARTLDLDLLLYGHAVIEDARLTVPHPGMLERAFVLYPLADLAPDLVLPDGRALRDALARCPAHGLRRIE